MVQYIGGAPRSGKTTLGKKISESTEKNIIHLDAFRAELYNTLSLKEQQNIFPVIHFLKIFPKYHKKMFNFFTKLGISLEVMKKFGCKDALEEFIKQNGIPFYLESEFLSQNLISSSFLSSLDDNTIFEGVSLSPELMYQNINSGMINKEDVLFIVNSNKHKIKNILETTPGSFQFRDIALMTDVILQYGEHIQNEAEKYNLPLLDTASIDFQKFIKDVKIFS